MEEPARLDTKQTCHGSESLWIIFVGETSGLLLDADDAGNGQDELQLTPGLALRVKGDLKTKIRLKSRPKTRFNHNVWARNG